MKKFLKAFFILVLSLYCYTNVSAENFTIHSEHAILYNLKDNTIIYEKASEEKTKVASLTKIMTAIVAIENIENLNKKVVLNSNVFAGLREANAAVAGFKVGDNVSYLDLLMGTMLPSGADAARGLAINIAGSEKEFVVLMNKKAKELNLTNTNFVNITGLDADNHYSTVKDISIILKYALNNPTFKQIYTTREYTTTKGLKLYSTLRELKKKFPADTSNILGTKTGYTKEAGLCLSSIANYNGVDYLLVTAGADSNSNSPLQLLDTLTIYNYYSNNYSYQDIITLNQEIINIPIKYNKNKYTVNSPTTISKYLPNTFNKEKITYKYIGVDYLSHKNKYLEEIGKIQIIYENEILDTIPIYLNEEIKLDVITYLIQTKIIYVIIFILIITIYFIYKYKKAKKRRILSQ